VANENDLWNACVALAEADTGGGGLVALSGKSNPLVQWGDSGMNSRPIVAGQLSPVRPRSPTGTHLNVSARFSAFVDGDDAGLETDLLDRLEAILTQPAFDAQGLDVAVVSRGRRDLAPLEQGSRRKDLELLLEYDR